MKKYWKITLIAIVILLGFGTLYINSVLSAPKYPEFVFDKQVGDEEEVNSLVLKGYYQEGGPRASFNTEVQVTSDGTEYINNISLLDQIIGYQPEKIKELQDEYRGFMRGKGTMINSFFESDQFVAYGDIKNKFDSSKTDFTFNVSLLNKSDNQTKSFTVKVPDSLEMDSLVVEEVQVIEDKLYLITQNFVHNIDDAVSEYHVYTIDVESKKLIESEKIFSNPESAQLQNEYSTNVSLIQTTDDQTNQRVLLLKTQQKDLQEQQRTEETVEEINVYNLVTGKMEKVRVPNKLKESQVSLFDGKRLYFTSYEKQGLVITQYNIEDKEIENEFKIELSNKIEGMISPLLSLKDEKLYVTTQQVNLNTTAIIAVVDVNTGKILYSGEIVSVNANKKAEQFELNLHEILIK